MDVDTADSSLMDWCVVGRGSPERAHGKKRVSICRNNERRFQVGVTSWRCESGGESFFDKDKPVVVVVVTVPDEEDTVDREDGDDDSEDGGVQPPLLLPEANGEADGKKKGITATITNQPME